MGRVWNIINYGGASGNLWGADSNDKAKYLHIFFYN